MKLPEVQFSLDLIQTEMERGAVTESRKEIGFKRANLLFDVRGLSLGARRMISAMLFLGSHEPDREMHDHDYAYFKWLAKISSRDHKWMSELIREGQSAGILMLDPDHPKANDEGFIRVPLLGPAGVKDGRIYFELYRSIRRQLANPEKYAFYSLRLSNRLDSLYAVTLYDNLLRESFKGTTDWIEVDDFLGWFDSKDKATFKNDGFRAITRYILKPHVPEINEKTNLTVTYETRSKGRKVMALRFHIKKKEQFRLPDEVTEESGRIFETLRSEFGLSNKNLDTILANPEWDEVRLNEVIELTRIRMAKGEVKSPGGLFMHLLAEGVRLTPTERAREARRQESQTQSSEKAVQTAKAQEAAKRAPIKKIDSILGRFADLDPDRQDALIQAFRDSSDYGAARIFLGKSAPQTLTADFLLKNVKMRGVFSNFLEKAFESKDADG